MKAMILFIMCFVCAFITLGQEKNQNEVGEFVVTAPTFFNGELAINSIDAYLADNFEFPYSYNKYGAEGTVIVQFYVNPSGNLFNFEVINSVDPKVDAEVIRVLKSTNGMWMAGLNNGVPAAMKKEVSIALRFANTSSWYKDRGFLSIAEYHFIKGSKKLLIKKNAKRALTHFNQGVKYLPYDKSVLVMRGVCKYELGDYQGAYKDWDRVKELGGFDITGSDLTLFIMKLIEQKNLMCYVAN